MAACGRLIFVTFHRPSAFSCKGGAIIGYRLAICMCYNHLKNRTVMFGYIAVIPNVSCYLHCRCNPELLLLIL